MCAERHRGRADAALAVIQLAQYGHRLRSSSARRKVPVEVRAPLAAEEDAIAADLKGLRTALACPGGATVVE